MVRRKRVYLPMTANRPQLASAGPWRPEAMTASPMGRDDLDAILDAALLDAMARAAVPAEPPASDNTISIYPELL
jgi:hypothetical protein